MLYERKTKQTLQKLLVLVAEGAPMTVHKLVIPDWDSHDDDTAPPDRPSNTAPHSVVRRVESRYARRSSTSSTAPANQLSLIDFDPTHLPEHLCGDIVSTARIFGSGDEVNVV